MLTTKLLAVVGLLFTMSSLLLGVRFWGYERAVILLQTGGLALILGLFFRITGGQGSTRARVVKALAELYDMESFTRPI